MEIYGVNWERTKARHTAFWKGELEGPCLLCVTAPKDNTAWDSFPYPKDKEGRVKWWTDAELIIKRYRNGFQGSYYAGDAFPVLIHDLGPAGHAAFFKGADPRFEGSIWFDPSLEDYKDLAFDPHSFLYQKTIELDKAYAEDAKGEYLVGMPDTVGAADVLSHLRGPDRFMTDFFDYPDEVKAALKTVQAVWEKTMAAVWGAVSENNYGGGCAGWLNTWAPGLHGQLQCDCSVMMSPDMFEEFLMYELQAQTDFLEYSLYHFDGEQQIRHLPHLLSVKGIAAIQWTNVAGQPPASHYIPQLKQIQQAGKGVILHCSPDEIPLLLENLSAGLTYLITWANSQAEADNIVKMTERMSRN
jgi:hypothetical protein